MIKKGLIIVVVFMVMVLSQSALTAPNIEYILKQMDDVTDLKSDITTKVIMKQQKTGEGVKAFESIYYRRDADDSFLIVMTLPETEKGNGYLKQGDNFWMYRRNTRTFQHISRGESIAGTDSKEEDFEKKKQTEMYKPALDASGKEKLTETKLGDIPVYQIEVDAKVDNVSYPKRIYWVRKDLFLPLKVQSYSVSGTLMQTAYFINYTQIQQKYIWIKAMFVDEFEKGNKTLAEIVNFSAKKIENYVFTKAYLENLSK